MMDFLLLVRIYLMIIYNYSNSILAAVDDDNIPVIIPRAIPQTECGWELYEKGYERRLKRLDQRQELINLVNSSRHETSDVTTSIDANHDSDN